MNSNVMGTIKTLRENSGYSQEALAKKSGLSLRTIQRLEGSNKAPKGHTLIAISEVFNVDSSVLLDEFKSVNLTLESDRTAIKLINLSVLAFFLIPFGNIVLPYFLWRKKKASKLIDEVGRKIVNFQILWTLLLSFLLCISPFINLLTSSSFPIILMVLFVALAINIIVICRTANSIHHNKIDILNLPVNFF